jgi:type I restriction enzyme S subunit
MLLCNQLEAARKDREAARDRLAAASLARLNAPDPDTFQADARFALNVLPALSARHDQVKQLRQTILNLAVRGKLVPQEPSDEPVSSLLTRISSRHTRPWVEASSFLQTAVSRGEGGGPHEVPPSWGWLTAEQLVDAGQAITYGILKPVWVERGVPTVRVTEMRAGEIDVAALPQCDPIRAAKFAKTTLRAGDLLVSKDGTIGKTAFVPSTLAGGNITQHVLRFPITDEVDRRFVRLVIDGPPYQALMAGDTKGVALKGVNVGDFRRMLLPVPPLAEQQRIVAKVDRLMALCDQLETSLKAGISRQSRLLDAVLHQALEKSAAVAA